MSTLIPISVFITGDKHLIKTNESIKAFKNAIRASNKPVLSELMNKYDFTYMIHQNDEGYHVKILQKEYCVPKSVPLHENVDTDFKLHKLPNVTEQTKRTRFTNDVIEDNIDTGDMPFLSCDDILIDTTDIKKDIYLSPSFNIGVLGCTSVGKSTFVNSILADHYAEMRVNKTTMCPQIYETNKKCVYNYENIKTISESIKRLNKELIETKSDTIVTEVTKIISPIGIFNEFENINFKLIDMPGLNDSETSDKMYTYVKNNFYNFDMIIFCIDINSGLGSTDELNILKLIQESMSTMKSKYNRDIKLMIICNKCDDMLRLDEDQINILYEQVTRIVYKNGINCPIIKYSSSYSHTYRSITSPSFMENTNEKMIDRMGMELIGQSWKLNCCDKSFTEKVGMIKEYVTTNEVKLLKLAGFNTMKDKMCEIIKESMFNLVYSKINFYNKKYGFKTKYNFIMSLNEMFNTDYGLVKIDDYLEHYLIELENRYNINIITNDVTVKHAEKLFHKLDELKSVVLSNDNYEKINQCYKKYRDMLGDYELTKLKERTIVSGDIIPILKQLKETSNCFAKLAESENIYYLNKVPIEDYNDMIIYLNNSGIDREILFDLYVTKFIENCNQSEYCGMIKNYLFELYIKTQDVMFNYMSCRVEYRVIKSLFNVNEYDRLLNNLYQVIKFYKPEYQINTTYE
jgi:GTPase SAR1 family protein